jgi:hypothetical protein
VSVTLTHLTHQALPPSYSYFFLPQTSHHHPDAANKCYPLWSPALSNGYSSLGMKLAYSGNDVTSTFFISVPSSSYPFASDTSGEKCFLGENTLAPATLEFRANTCTPFTSVGGSLQLVLRLSAGSIAGIVIAVVAVLALLYLRSAKKGPFRPKDGAVSNPVTTTTIVQLPIAQMMALVSSNNKESPSSSTGAPVSVITVGDPVPPAGPSIVAAAAAPPGAAGVFPAIVNPMLVASAPGPRRPRGLHRRGEPHLAPAQLPPLQGGHH